MTDGVARERPLWFALGFLSWLGFAAIAVVAGIFRVLWLQPRLGEHSANLVETLGLTLLFGVIIWVAVPWLVPGMDAKDLWRMGLYWLVLTVAFEFIFGHYVDGASWSALLANYDVTAGRLWILIPLMMGTGPALLGKVRRRSVSWRTIARAR